MKVSKYANTMYNRYLKVASRLSLILNQTIAYSYTIDQLTEELKGLWASPDYKKLSYYYKGVIHGRQEALIANLHENNHRRIGWFHVYKGVFYKEWNDLPQEAKTLPVKQPIKSGHYWNDNHKPFSEG